MDKHIIFALQDLGLSITDVQYKFPPENEFAFGLQPTRFVVKGSFHNEGQLMDILSELFILRALRANKNTAVRDLYEKLKTTAEVTKMDNSLTRCTNGKRD